MKDKWIRPDQCPTLAVLVETVTAPLLIQHPSPIGLETDIDPDLPIPACPIQTASLIETLVNQTLEEMVDGGDFAITACRTASGTVLEIRDDRRAEDERAHSIPFVAGQLGAKLDWQNSDAGGVLLRVTFPDRGQLGRMAA